MCPKPSDDPPGLNPLEAERERRIARDVEAHRLKLLEMREQLRKNFQAVFGPYSEVGADKDALDPAVEAAIDDLFQQVERLYFPDDFPDEGKPAP